MTVRSGSIYVQQRLARVHALAVRAGNVGQRGHGAGVDERACRLQLTLAVGRAHGQVGGVDERGLAVDDLDARVVGEHPVAPFAQAGRGLVLLVDHGLVALGARRELASFERAHGSRVHEHLRGEAGGVDASPAVHAGRALDHGDGEARVRQVERQRLAGCSESDDRRIYLVHGSSFPRGPRGRMPPGRTLLRRSGLCRVVRASRTRCVHRTSWPLTLPAARAPLRRAITELLANRDAARRAPPRQPPPNNGARSLPKPLYCQ